MTRILLTGKNGQVGFELQRALAPLGEVLALDRRGFDLHNEANMRDVIKQFAPNIIVNPAAYTAVDKAQSEPELAQAINAHALAVIGEEAAKLNALVVHYSTDYVYDGHKPDPYEETDTPAPQSVYGKSKLAGEQALINSQAAHLIFRTSWVVGAYGNNFAKTMLRLAAERDGLRVVADQFGAPTSAALIADVTAQVLGQYLNRGDKTFPQGVYHLAAAGETTWHAYAKWVIGRAIEAGRTLKTQPEEVEAIATSAYPLPAPRPLNSRLNTQRLCRDFGLTMPPWQQGLEHVMRLILL
ncbi:MAG TPA: dTDP-4-dehydrorhamnose reductase [Marinagarivorans sp.]|nr:dTDP-4-dehydrorhamnose reductase [Cellvibrionaceae bacterium]HMY39117.1 dTDP-4-dehydrorhamnose reductase [Marinagarivorans sp.]HNG61656.1 dTDP-4-dehydrorhamnose reductase [Cellvibrionaceae bacterium]